MNDFGYNEGITNGNMVGRKAGSLHYFLY